MGGSLTAAKDIALASNGGTAFAKDCITGFTQHSIGDLTTASTATATVGSATANRIFAAWPLPAPCTIDSLAFGRDNTALPRPLHRHLYLPVHDNGQPERQHAGQFVDVLRRFLSQYGVSQRDERTSPRLRLRSDFRSHRRADTDVLRRGRFCKLRLHRRTEVYAATVPEPGTLAMLAAASRVCWRTPGGDARYPSRLTADYR